MMGIWGSLISLGCMAGDRCPAVSLVIWGKKEKQGVRPTSHFLNLSLSPQLQCKWSGQEPAPSTWGYHIADSRCAEGQDGWKDHLRQLQEMTPLKPGTSRRH